MTNSSTRASEKVAPFGRLVTPAAAGDTEHDAEPEAPASTRAAVLKKVETWCGETTLHGVANIIKDDHWTAYKITWLCIVLVAMGANAYHLYTVIDGYLQYPTTEVTSVNTVSPDFPHVTICNQFAPSQSRADAFLTDPTSSLAQFVDLVSSNEATFHDYEDETGIAAEDILLSPTGVYTNLDMTEVEQVGHDIRDFILSCTYSGIACDMDNDFTLVHDSAFFNCFTFTGAATASGLDIGSGPDHGLSLILYLESEVDGNPYDLSAFEYSVYSPIQYGVGARVEIHGEREMPNVQAAGFDVMPGHSTNMKLTATEVIKQPKPYSNCTERKNLQQVSGYRYSSARCIDECAAEYVYAKCGCAPALYTMTDSMAAAGASYCSKFAADDGMTVDTLLTNIECEIEFSRDFNTDSDHRHDCECYESCDYTIYDETISESRWPAPLYLDDMFREYVLNHDDAASLKAAQQLRDIAQNDSRSADFKELVYNNFARLNIYFRDVIIINIDEYPTYDAFTLLANIGGTIGLWAGLSMLTLTDIGFLIGSICMTLGQNLRRKRNNVETIQDEELQKF